MSGKTSGEKVTMFESIFRRKKLIAEKLAPYGFIKEKGQFLYRKDLFEGEFILTVRIAEDGTVATDLTETETGEPYVLYKTNASGSFVGEVRIAIEQVLEEIAEHCYKTAVFQSRQAQTVIEFIRETYGDELEFLWQKSPQNAIWRRKDSQKWYGAILTIEGNKIGLKTAEPVEIIDLRMKKEQAEGMLARPHYYPGWHMNKKSWYTIVLDGSVPDEELLSRIQESYELAYGGKHYE